MIIASYEMRMSHWVEHAALYALPEERVIVSIGDTNWSADKIVWEDGGGRVSIDLRRYPGDVPGVTLTIDIERGLARFGGRANLRLGEVSATLEADYFARGGRG